MVLFVHPRTTNHPFPPDLPITRELVPSLFEVNNLKFVEIGSASLQIRPYKILPSTKIFLTRPSFFFSSSNSTFSFIFIAHFFSWACGRLRESQKFFSNYLFVHSIVCLITHSFLHGFQPNLYQHFSYVCSTCLTTFSLK